MFISYAAVLLMASSAHAVFPEPFAGYLPRTDVETKYLEKDLIQYELENIMEDESCPAVALGNDYYTFGAGSSHFASIPTQTLPISAEWNEYRKFTGDGDMHHTWVRGAFDKTDLSNTWDRFGPNFATAYPNNICSGEGGCVGQEASVTTATSYLFGYIEIMQLMEKAISVARQGQGCNPQFDTLNNFPICMDGVELWDAAAATFVGSLSKTGVQVTETDSVTGARRKAIENNNKTMRSDKRRRRRRRLAQNHNSTRSNTNSRGVYNGGQKECSHYRLCGQLEYDTSDTLKVARINAEIMELLAAGSHAAYSGDVRRMKYYKRRISALMTVPMVQGTLRYAWRMSSSGNESSCDRDVAEGATLALQALPKLWACSQSGYDAIGPMLQTGGAFAGTGSVNPPDYVKIKLVFECNYRCLGISCEDVGSLYIGDSDEPTADTTKCDDKENGTRPEDVAKCVKINPRTKKKCKTYTGKSGIAKRANLEYFVQSL